ncbi:MAG: alpha/beta fold hydrolase [Azoarcus sp.]|jgi:pimeloyl-ACP methyl ester carboxylesterase|nr:alpha/beta fold hydrolase [Azoarcus sp.]
MSLIDIGKIELETVIHGEAGAPAVLLIQGLATPLTRWPAALIAQLTGAGLRVITFDNRDIGLSTRMDILGLPNIKRLMNAWTFAPPFARAPRLPALPIPYTLADMAADAVKLLDALRIEAAHIAGASLGGMIAQLLAARHPRRCLSLTSIMSSSGNPLLPPPSPAALRALFAPLPRQRDEASLVTDGIWRQKALMSPAYPTPDEELRQMFIAEHRRGGFHPAGIIRQLAALLTGGDRRPLLLTIRAPTVVLHGTDDPLINIACGRDTAASIPGAEFRPVSGMGHDFPRALAPEFAAAILAAAHRAETPRPHS